MTMFVGGGAAYDGAISYLVTAGGASGGGNPMGGGGGAGGFRTGSATLTKGAVYTVTVGDGGAAAS